MKNFVDVSVMKTLAYARVFSFWMKTDEIYKYSIGKNFFSYKKLLNTLKKLDKNDDIFKKRGAEEYYWRDCTGSDKSYSILNKKCSIEKTHNKLELLLTISKYITNNSHVVAVFLTGSVAVHNTKPGDDIDLLVVTKHRRLWTTRLMLTLMLDILQKRRKPEGVKKNDREVANKICLNMYLDVENLAIPKDMRSLYTAHEVMQAKVLYDSENIYERFLKENDWVREYLPHCSPFENVQSVIKLTHSSSTSSIGAFFENCAYSLQTHYMKSKKTTEITTPFAAFFHPGNQSAFILNKYKQNLTVS